MVPERERLLLQVHWNRIQSFDFSAHDLVALSLYSYIYYLYKYIYIGSTSRKSTVVQGYQDLPASSSSSSSSLRRHRRPKKNMPMMKETISQILPESRCFQKEPTRVLLSGCPG